MEGTVTVTWTGIDEDGDALNYSLLYSADGGREWKTLVTRSTATSYDLDTADLAGSDAGLFRVIANDGVNTSRANAGGPVQVAFKSPSVRIESPASGQEFGDDQTIILQGSARGVDSKAIGPAEYSWTSSVDGSLGSGVEILPQDLSVGEHVITLAVTGGNGLEGRASILVTVNATSKPAPVAAEGISDFAPDTQDSYLEPGKITGRAIIGPVSEVGESSFTVVTAQGDVKVSVDDGTTISAPPDLDLGLEIITVDPPTRVAVLSIQPALTGNCRAASSSDPCPVTALKITLIPSQSSRTHTRVVISGEPSDGTIGFVSSNGGGSSLSSQFGQGLEKGDNMILLIQTGPGAGGQGKISAVIDGGLVAQRLENLAVSPTGNPGVLSLFENHLNDQQALLQGTLNKISGVLQGFRPNRHKPVGGGQRCR